MDKQINKSNESSISTTGTTGSPPFSDTMENNVKYMNLNFVDNSESSSQAKDAGIELKIPPQSFEATAQKASKPPPSKILPSSIPLPGKYETQKPKATANLKEKSLIEMGFKTNEIQGWEDIVQPPKENLYKLLKNMIDNHIKPNVQIRIGGVTFNCHMMVLQCYSDFFMECNNEVLIQLPEEKITPGAFMMVYDWMLAEEPLVQREGILELFNAANFLRIKNLVNQCWLCLDDDVRFREDTAFLLYLEARNYGLESLEQLMLTRICKFFLTLVASKEFLDLATKEICTLLSSNTIGVNSEIEIFMSVVRWLNHNWEERELDMLNVVKCVRFSLMPPWFLVTLNKNIDCVEIDRIASHPEVKRMINDGISYTTTQLYYGENREEFLHFLERYQLIAPVQRQWVFDKECSYHHRLECPNMQYVTYKSFLEYLEMIQSIGKDYWRSLEMAKGIEKSMQCCVRSDCRKLNDQNLASVFTVNYRDQGVQVENSLRHRKLLGRGLDPRVSRENRSTLPNSVSLKNLTKPAQSNQKQMVTSTASSCHEYICKQSYDHRYQAKSRYQHYRDQCTSDHIHYEDNFNCSHKCNESAAKKEIPQVSNCVENIMLSDVFDQCSEVHHCITGGCIHMGVSSVRYDSHPTNNVVQSITLYSKASQTPLNISNEVGTTRQPPINNYSKGLLKKNEDLTSIQNPRRTLPTVEETDFKATRSRKILIIGGIDPYCQHCQHDKLFTEHRKRAQKMGGSDADSVITVSSNGSIGLTDDMANEMENFGDQVLYYDDGTLQWKHLCYIPFGSRHHHSAVVCNGLIYIIGGTKTALGCTKKSIFEKSVWSFDPQTFKWTFECNLPELRRDFAAIVSDETCVGCEHCTTFKGTSKRSRSAENGFFVIGGEGVNGTALHTVWYYHVVRKTWKKKASLNAGRYGLTAAMVNNEIWIAGGIIENKMKTSDGNAAPISEAANAASAGGDGLATNGSVVDVITDSMEYYSLKCLHSLDCVTEANNNINGCTAETGCGDGGQWIKSKQHLRVPRLFGKFAKISDNSLYLVGGIGFNTDDVLTSLSSVDHYNFGEGKWYHSGDIICARHGHDVATLEDRIVVIGGVSTIKKCTLSQVESFCTKTHKSFIDTVDLPWPLSGSAVVTLE